MRYRLKGALDYTAYVTIEPDERFREVWAAIIRAARIVDVKCPEYSRLPTRDNPTFQIGVYSIHPPPWPRRSVLQTAQCALRRRKRSANAQQ